MRIMQLAYSALLTPFAILSFYAPASLRRGSAVMNMLNQMYQSAPDNTQTNTSAVRVHQLVHRPTPEQSEYTLDNKPYRANHAACVFCFIDPHRNSFFLGTSKFETVKRSDEYVGPDLSECTR